MLSQELGSEEVVINVYPMNGRRNAQVCLGLEQTFCNWKEACVRGNDDANWYPDGAQLLGLGEVAAKSSSSSFNVSYYPPENREEGTWFQQRNGNV